MKLKQLIFERKIKQNKLAKELNITPSNLNKYVNESIEPNIETLIKLANYFNVSLDYLCENEQNTNLTKQQLELLEFAKLINNDIDMGKLIGYAKSLAEKQISTEQKILNTLKEID